MSASPRPIRFSTAARARSAVEFARDRLVQLGWSEIEVDDEDLGCSAAGRNHARRLRTHGRRSCLGKVGAVAAREVLALRATTTIGSSLSKDVRVVDTLLVDQEAVYAPRQGNDRLLLGLKGNLDASLTCCGGARCLRYEKARGVVNSWSGRGWLP